MHTFHTAIEMLGELRASYTAQAAGYRYDSATPELTTAFNRKVAFEGLRWGYANMRLCFAAEDIIKSCETEDAMLELADLLIARVEANPNYGMAIGGIAGELNLLARERFEAAEAAKAKAKKEPVTRLYQVAVDGVVMAHGPYDGDDKYVEEMADTYRAIKGNKNVTTAIVDL